MLRSVRKFSHSTLSAIIGKRNLVSISHPAEGVARLTMGSAPVNTMDVPLMKAVIEALKEIEGDKKINSLILDSSVKVFSAGLDLKSMYGKSTEELNEFWKVVRECWGGLYATRLATICAMQGHAPAGGCLLAITCDYRILSANGSIGLNEAAFGLIAPTWGIHAMVEIMGRRQAEMACSVGTIFKPDDALRLGLVDHVAATPDEVPDLALSLAKKWGKIPGRAGTKHRMRFEYVDTFHRTADEDIDGFVGLVSSPRVQGALGAYIASLGSKK
jgi:3,2-trans-enoyl-CoA isomerase